MAVFGVVMNQAVSMTALGDNMLATGYKEGQFLFSCSAVIFANPAAAAAALYHFPAGDIYQDKASRVLIKALVAEVKPTEAFVAFGTVKRLGDPLGDEATNPGQTNALLEWLHGQLKFAPHSGPARLGLAAISIKNGRAGYKLDNLPVVTDLEHLPAGTYNEGYKIYWKTDLPPALRRSNSDNLIY